MYGEENSHARACIGAGSRAPARERPLRVLPAGALTERARGFFRPGTPPCDERGEMRQPTSEPMADLLGGVTVHSRAAERAPALPLAFEGRGAADAHRVLGRSGVHSPAGSFHALEASRRPGLGGIGGLRAGLSAYNDADDVERPL